MSRVVKQIEIEGKPAVALFATEVGRCFVRRDMLPEAHIHVLGQPYRVRLGEKRIEVKEICIMMGKIDGLDFDVEADVVDDLERADGQRLDAIIGSFDSR